MNKNKKIISIKKSKLILGVIILFGAAQLVLPKYFPDLYAGDNSRVTLLVVIMSFLILILTGLYFKLDEQALSTKEFALIVIYSAFSAVARIPFVVTPNFQPNTYLIFCAGYVFGPLVGFAIGANTALISNFVLGQGPWTIYQIFAWGMVGISGGLLNRSGKRQPKPIFLALIGFLWGFGFGWIMNIWGWFMFISPLNLSTWLLYNLSSVWFDLVHGIGNFLFLYYFGKRTINILYRYRQRFLVKIEPTEA